MNTRILSFLNLTFAFVFLLAISPASAAPPAERIFPRETVVWMSLSKAPEFQTKYQRTQLGQLAQDETLKPFADHLRKQMLQRFGNIEASLGVTMEDVMAAAGGELAIGLAHPEGKRAATIITIDTQGQDAQAAELNAKVDAAMATRKAKASSISLSGVDATLFQVPAQPKARLTSEEVVRLEVDGLLCYVESRQQAQSLVGRIKGSGKGVLTELEEFRSIMSRCSREHQSPDMRWFVAPFKYDAARRSRQTSSALPEKKDTFQVLGEQGFEAIRGVGGHVQVAADSSKDFIHHTSVYAPPQPGTAGKPAREKYQLGMRMAETPNRLDLNLENWAPRGTANYSTFSLDVQNAFDNLESVFDALAGYAGAMRNTLNGFEKDPFGPKIKVRQEIIANLGNRVTRMADYRLPITTDCERYLFVIQALNAAALKGPIDKLMENDGAVLRDIRGIKYWEIVPEEEVPVAVQLGGGLIPLDGQAGDEEPADQPLLRSAAVCIHKGNLIIASDVEYLEQAVFGAAPGESLAGSYDYQASRRELDKLADLNRCSWSFTRTDETIRPTYELLREGKLPEGQTFVARLLNELLTTPEEEERGIVRKQRIDGRQLPSFELARRYFGPTARAIKAEDDGWFVTGVVLNKAGE